ncbi:MAG: hypothetical protein NUV73_04470 [Candidatus Daviesbacteria bacterium]|nr:hypothetical protein [Candidatus Daviesbacteria bacterium]
MEKPKQYKTNPTIKQKIAVQKLVEIVRNNKGKKNITLGHILQEAGYSKAVSLHPTHVTETKGWNSLMQQYFNEESVAKFHKMMFESKILRWYTFPLKERDSAIRTIIESLPEAKMVKVLIIDKSKRAYFTIPNLEFIDKALDKAYKVRGKYINNTGEVPQDDKYIEEITLTLRRLYASKRGTVNNPQDVQVLG